jgi:hypothetical protein
MGIVCESDDPGHVTRHVIRDRQPSAGVRFSLSVLFQLIGPDHCHFLAPHWHANTYPLYDIGEAFPHTEAFTEDRYAEPGRVTPIGEIIVVLVSGSLVALFGRPRAKASNEKPALGHRSSLCLVTTRRVLSQWGPPHPRSRRRISSIAAFLPPLFGRATE